MSARAKSRLLSGAGSRATRARLSGRYERSREEPLLSGVGSTLLKRSIGLMITLSGRRTLMTTDSENMLHRESVDPPADLVAGLAGSEAKPVRMSPNSGSVRHGPASATPGESNEGKCQGAATPRPFGLGGRDRHLLRGGGSRRCAGQHRGQQRP